MIKRVTLFLLALSSPIFAACHAVGPTATGAGTGVDWNNQMVQPSGTSWVRGDIYYFADGAYGTSLSVSTNASGTTTIELRKAQSYDNGSSCATSIAAGWNTSTMGSSQAVWHAPAAAGTSFINLGSGGYYIFNGNGQNAGTSEVGCGGVQTTPPGSMTGAAPNPAACGLKFDASTCTSTATNGCDGGNGEMHGGGPGIIFESMEWKGQGLNSNGNNNSETYFWFANGGSLAGVTISHNYLHNASTTYYTVVSGGWTGTGSFDHNYAWGIFDGSINHGEAVQLQGSNGSSGSHIPIHHNIFRDQQTNGDVVAVITGTEYFDFYDNADVCSTGGTSTTCRHNDGIIGCFNSQVCSGVNVYNNTFSEPSSCGWNITGGTGAMNVFNNLYFNCGSVGMSGSVVTVDYNSYLNSSQAAVGVHDVSATGVSNPFLGVGIGNVQLSADSANYNGRTSLGAPFDTVDLYGNAFTTDRGAAQFVSGSTVASPTANPGSGTYVGTQYVTLSDSTSGATICWTEDGTTPTASGGTCTHGNTYSAVIPVQTALTIQAIGTLSGSTNSSVVTFTYAFTPTTWYVLSGGGTRTTCTGQTNAVDPGTGATPRNCAFGDFRWLYDNQVNNNWKANGTSWVIAGGDTVIATSASPIAAVSGLIAASAGPYNRIGWDYGGACSGTGCGAGFTWCNGVGQCGIPPPPPGTVSAPTHIWGANHGACSTTTTLPGALYATTIPNNANVFEVYGDFGLNTTFDLSGTTYVDVQCFGITTHGDCIIHISPNTTIPCSTSIPLSSYGSEGIRSNPSTGVITMSDVWIHGFQDSCWLGPIDGNVTMTDVRMSYCVETGFNMDDGTDPQAGGTVTLHTNTHDFNGCNQKWPFVTTIPIDYCSDQNSAGDGDGVATPSSSSDTFVVDHETSAYNTQDGFDVGHNQDPGSITWNTSIMFGNMGGTFKSGGQSATMINNVSVTNCFRMAAPITGVPSTFNTELSLYCRASGDGVGLNWLGGGSGEVVKVQDNAIITYGGTGIDFQTQGTGTCTGCTFVVQSNTFLAYNNSSTGYAHNPSMYNGTSPTTTGSNTIFNFFGYTCTGTDQCVDVLFVGEPPPGTTLGNSGLDSFNFNLSSSSPSTTSGLTISGITTDYFGTTRLNPTSAGAVQFVSIFTNNSTTCGKTVDIGHTAEP